MLLGAGFAHCHSTLQTRATELAPEARGTAISLFLFSLFVGSAVGTAVLGQLVETRGYRALLLSCGVALALLGLATPRLTAPASAPAKWADAPAPRPRSSPLPFGVPEGAWLG